MGTQKKILLALMAIMIFVVLLVVIALKINAKREQVLIDYNIEQLQLRSDAILKDQEHRIYQVINDYTYWDPFVDFAKNHDQTWAEENLSTIVYSFKLESVWVLDLNGDVLFSAFDSVQKPIQLSFDKEMLHRLYQNRSINYNDSINGGAIMIQGATIHPTKDPEKNTDPQAFFFMVKRWDEAMINSVEEIAGCKVQKSETKSVLKTAFVSDSISVLQALKTWDNTEIGYLIFTSKLDVINLLRRISVQMEWLLILSLLALFTSIGFLLSRLVSKPLRLVSEIIETEDLSKITILKRNSLDFERIGNLIELFVNQKKELISAIHLARASDQIKTDFLNNISHEVRTPLNGLVGASSLISEPDLPVEIRIEMIDIINISTKRLLRTITQYMDISLLSSDNMPVYLAETELFEFLNPVIEEAENECKEKNLKLILDFPQGFSSLNILTDKSLLDKLLHHILNNASKFTDNGSVTFGFKIKQSFIEFFVRDTGVGIDQKVQPMIFKNFTQEDSSSLRRFEGSGLGLAICGKISELLKGRIWFDSEKEKGTTFYFTIPFDEKMLVKEVENTSLTDENMPYNPIVLIAEDEDSNFFVLEAILRKQFNVEVLRAFNGLEAVEYCQNFPTPNIILMDIKMPVMNGYEATKILKLIYPSLPIIAVTAYSMSGDEARVYEAGCDDYISKPINSKNIIEKLGKYLERK